MNNSKTLNASWNLLKYCSLAASDPAHREAAARVVVDGAYDADLLIGLAARHGLVPSLASFFFDDLDLVVRLPHKTRQHLRDTLVFNRMKATEYLAEAARIGEMLAASDIPFAFTKGIVAQIELYETLGLRTFNDIDIMAKSSDGERIHRILEKLGYVDDRWYDDVKQIWHPVPRSQTILYSLYRDHLPHHYRVNGGSPVGYCVDVAFSLTWDSSRWEVPTEHAIEYAREVVYGDGDSEVSLRALPKTYDFLFHVLHLFREGWFERTIVSKDLRLAQFVDILRGWRCLDQDERISLRDLIAEHDLGLPVAWVMCHTDSIFETELVESLRLQRFDREEWVNSARGGSSYLRWEGDMEARLLGDRLLLEPVEPIGLLKELDDEWPIPR